jgi:hypothetical protein
MAKFEFMTLGSDGSVWRVNTETGQSWKLCYGIWTPVPEVPGQLAEDEDVDDGD